MAKSKTIRGGLPPDKYLSREQVERLMGYVRKEAEKARANGSARAAINEMIIELLFRTGLRARDICQLQIRDLPIFHGKNAIYVRDSKGHVSRSVMISMNLTAKIADFVKRHRKSYKPKTALIPSERGYRKRHWRGGCAEFTSGLSYRSLYSKVKGLGERAGIGKLHAHMLRHTYGTRLYNIEKDLRFVQDQLGHASLNTTQIYTKTEETSRRRQIEGLNI